MFAKFIVNYSLKFSYNGTVLLVYKCLKKQMKAGVIAQRVRHLSWEQLIWAPSVFNSLRPIWSLKSRKSNF